MYYSIRCQVTPVRYERSKVKKGEKGDTFLFSFNYRLREPILTFDSSYDSSTHCLPILVLVDKIGSDLVEI